MARNFLLLFNVVIKLRCSQQAIIAAYPPKKQKKHHLLPQKCVEPFAQRTFLHFIKKNTKSGNFLPYLIVIAHGSFFYKQCTIFARSNRTKSTQKLKKN